MHLGVCTVITTYLKASKLSSSSGLGVGYNPSCVDRVFCIAGVLSLINLWLSKLCCFVLNSPTTAGEALSLCIVKVLYIVSYNYKSECIQVHICNTILANHNNWHTMHIRQNLRAVLPRWHSTSEARGLSHINSSTGATSSTSRFRPAWYTLIPLSSWHSSSTRKALKMSLAAQKYTLITWHTCMYT